jgi:hypothetical protein
VKHDISPAQHWFLAYGDECYATTRFCYFAFMQSLVFRLAHHTLEYYLKAALAKSSNLPELKRLGHRLRALADRYEARHGSLGLGKQVLEYMDLFERLRYPRVESFTHVVWGLPYAEFFRRFETPELRERCACFHLSNFDELVSALRGATVPPEWTLWGGLHRMPTSTFIARMSSFGVPGQSPNKRLQPTAASVGAGRRG